MTVDPCPEAGHQALVIGNASMKDRCAGWLRLVTKGHGPWAYQNKFRFRNHISTLPQPNFGDSATENIYASATKKSRFRNQKKTIPQPKKDDSATKKSRFRNQKTRFRNQKKMIPQPPSTRFRNQNPRHTCGHTQHGIVSRCGVG